MRGGFDTLQLLPPGAIQEHRQKLKAKRRRSLDPTKPLVSSDRIYSAVPLPENSTWTVLPLGILVPSGYWTMVTEPVLLLLS